MAIEDLGSIDAIGVDRETGFVVLTVADAWDWSDEVKHLEVLQAKLNSYLNFIESGEVWSSFPDSAGRTVVVDIVMRYKLPTAAEEFIAKARHIFSEQGIQLRHRHFGGGSG